MIQAFRDIHKDQIRGIVRQIDRLGRLVIPKEYLRELGWGLGSEVELFALEDGVFVRAAHPEHAGHYYIFDRLGRLSIPVRVRRCFGIGIDDPLEMFLLTDGVFIRKKP
jgi:bifunctional DNA-binding transcriptional regulator/antitoxin component of YhaV-PrlF toxin-antitoxin module